MNATSLDRHIETTADVCGGRPRIAGRRITVDHVMVWHEQLGRSAEEIAAEHDLSLTQVYAALAYYYEHRDEIDARMKEDATFAEELRRQTPSKLAQKLHGRPA